MKKAAGSAALSESAHRQFLGKKRVIKESLYTEDEIFTALGEVPVYFYTRGHVSVVYGMVKIKGMDDILLINDPSSGAKVSTLQEVKSSFLRAKVPNPNPNPPFTAEKAAELLNVLVSFMNNILNLYE